MNPSFRSVIHITCGDYKTGHCCLAKLNHALTETPQTLTEALKWPFCVGETHKLVVAALADRIREEKLGKPTFNGDVCEFVKQAPSLGIKNLDGPAIRPKAEDAIAELETLRTKGK